MVVNPFALSLLEGFRGLAGVLELDLDPAPELQEPVIRGTLAPRICHLAGKPAIGFGPGDHGPFNPTLGHQVTMA